MKNIIYFLAISIHLSFFSNSIVKAKKPNRSNEYGMVKVSQFKCDVSEDAYKNIIYRNNTCYAKTYKRVISTMSGNIWMKVPINKLFVKFDAFELH
jgi:hypothetical protein